MLLQLSSFLCNRLYTLYSGRYVFFRTVQAMMQASEAEENEVLVEDVGGSS